MIGLIIKRKTKNITLSKKFPNQQNKHLLYYNITGRICKNKLQVFHIELKDHEIAKILLKLALNTTTYKWYDSYQTDFQDCIVIVII
jgi:nitrogenase subunit NifH